MPRPRKLSSYYIPLEEFNLAFTQTEVDKVKELWDEGLHLTKIAKGFAGDQRKWRYSLLI